MMYTAIIVAMLDKAAAESARQKAEIERLKNKLVEWKRQAGKYGAGCELCDEREKENERLRAALRCISQRASYGTITPGVDEIKKLADAALEQWADPDKDLQTAEDVRGILKG